MGTCRMGHKVGAQLWKTCLPFYLALLFPSPLLFPSCSILIPLLVVSLQCGVPSVEGSSGWGTFKSSQGLDCCRASGLAVGLLPSLAFRLGRFIHSLVRVVIRGFCFLRSVRYLFASLCFLLDGHCASWGFVLTSLEFGVCELHCLLVLSKCP